MKKRPLGRLEIPIVPYDKVPANVKPFDAVNFFNDEFSIGKVVATHEYRNKSGELLCYSVTQQCKINNLIKIVAVASILACVGAVAIQLKVSADILSLFFKNNTNIITVLVTLIIVVYSAFGGIRSVTFTDILQFFTFASIIPIVAIVIWGTNDNPGSVFITINENPLFNYEEVFDLKNPKFLNSILLFLFFIIPTIEPTIFQRISMSRNITQVYKSFALASIICLLVSLMISWIGILILSENANLDTNNLLPYIIEKYGYIGLKGLLAIGFLAITMSTADSYMNSASVIITNDLVRYFDIKFWWLTNTLLVSRIASVIMACLAFFLAFNSQSLLDLTLLIWGSYMPVITVPFLLAIFGFRTSHKPILIGMASGIITRVIFTYFEIEINSIIPAMVLNVLFVVLSHYLLKQPRGVIGIQNKEALQKIMEEKKEKRKYYIESIKKFSLIRFALKINPKNEVTYFSFGIFSIISVFSIMYTIPVVVKSIYPLVIATIYHSALITSSIFITYPIWPNTFKNQAFISILWLWSLLYILVFLGYLQVILSGFSELQIMMFLLNLIVLALLCNWKVVLSLLVIGVIAAIEFFKIYLDTDS